MLFVSVAMMISCMDGFKLPRSIAVVLGSVLDLSPLGCTVTVSIFGSADKSLSAEG